MSLSFEDKLALVLLEGHRVRFEGVGCSDCEFCGTQYEITVDTGKAVWSEIGDTLSEAVDRAYARFIARGGSFCC